MYVRKYHRTLWSRVRTTYGLYVSLSRTKVHYALRGTKSDSWGTQGVHRRRQVYHTYKSGVWTKIYLRHERWDLIWSDLIWFDLIWGWKLWDLGSENTTGFFDTLAGFFSRGCEQMSPALSVSYERIFERNLVGLANFAGSKFQRMANGPVSTNKTKLGELY